MLLNGGPDPQRQFMPFKHEAKRVMKLGVVRAIRARHLISYKMPNGGELVDAVESFYRDAP